MIRVGTIKYVNGKKVFPSYPEGKDGDNNFKRIEVMTYSTEYGDIGPYCLKDDKGRIVENIYSLYAHL